MVRTSRANRIIVFRFRHIISSERRCEIITTTLKQHTPNEFFVINCSNIITCYSWFDFFPQLDSDSFCALFRSLLPQSISTLLSPASLSLLWLMFMCVATVRNSNIYAYYYVAGVHGPSIWKCAYMVRTSHRFCFMYFSLLCFSQPCCVYDSMVVVVVLSTVHTNSFHYSRNQLHFSKQHPFRSHRNVRAGRV